MSTICGWRTVPGLLEHRARAAPEDEALIFDDLEGGVRRWSWAELAADTLRCARALEGLGVGRGDAVHVHLGNCPEFLLAWFALARLGAVMVPTNPQASPAELAYLLGHSGARLSLTSAALRASVEGLRGRCPRLGEVIACDRGALAERLAAEPPEPPAAPPPGPHEVAAILYTSGTTSHPKGVQVTHANYVYAGETVAKAIRLAPEDRHLVVLPLFHGNAQYYSTMSALVSGAGLALMARFSASRYFAQARRHGCTVGSLFAAPMRMLLAQPERPGEGEHRLRVVLFAQNLTEVQLAEWQRRFGAPLLQLWGMTETMAPPLMNPIDGERRNMTLGLPALGYEVELVDEAGRAVAPGEVGQIVVRGIPGETLMAGYLANPEATAEALRDGWLWSGDTARLDEAGYFRFVDRAKDLIKRAGENVSASEVEAVLALHPEVFECAVVGVPDPLRDQAIVAFVVAREGCAPGAEALIEWCRERLAPFRVPERIVFREALPRTSVGKIQKHLLRAELA